VTGAALQHKWKSGASAPRTGSNFGLGFSP
jgi:hypothetical protein